MHAEGPRLFHCYLVYISNTRSFITRQIVFMQITFFWPYCVSLDASFWRTKTYWNSVQRLMLDSNRTLFKIWKLNTLQIVDTIKTLGSYNFEVQFSLMTLLLFHLSLAHSTLSWITRLWHFKSFWSLIWPLPNQQCFENAHIKEQRVFLNSCLMLSHDIQANTIHLCSVFYYHFVTSESSFPQDKLVCIHTLDPIWNLHFLFMHLVDTLYKL